MNNKLASFFCDPKKALKNVGLMLLMIFIVIYAGFQILPSFSRKIETETALLVSIHDLNETSGYIFRDETVVMNTSSGVPVTLVKDGQRVYRGQHYANVYSTEEYADLQEEINSIKSKIEILEKSVVETNAYVTDITKTDASIASYFDTIYDSIADGRLDGVSGAQDNLLVSLNKRELIVNANEGYKNKINSLKAERAQLEGKISAVSQRLVAPEAGYFYGDADGYEEIFSQKSLESLTLESFKELTSATADESVLNSACGKIVKDFVWHVVCESDKDSAAAYNEGYYYYLNFPSFSEEELKMKLEKIIKSTSSETVLLVFRGNTAPDGFTYQRHQQVNIISDKYTGLAIPKEALRIVDGRQGVYIMSGDIVRFRAVDIIFENEDYYIVSTTPLAEIPTVSEEDSTPKYQYLSLYDSVIIKGKNLFDGKTSV